MFRRNQVTPLRNTRRFHKMNRVIVIIAPLILLAASIFLLTNSSHFQIKNIEISSGACVERDELITQSNFLGKNIIFVDTSVIEKKLKEKNLCLLNIEIKKILPDKILIMSKNREAALNIISLLGLDRLSLPEEKQIILDSFEATASSAAAYYKLDFSIKESSVSGKFLADKEGFLFSRIQDEKKDLLTVYIVDPEIGLGKQVSSKLVDDLLIINTRLKELQYDFGDVKIIGRNILINGEVRVVFSLDRDLNRQLASLQLIWQKAKMNSKSIDQIDLRFDKPVLEYSPKRKE